MRIRACLLLIGLAASLPAQDAPRPGRITWPPQLSAKARGDLTNLADTAAAAGLPVDPLVAKAAEGLLKGADESRILLAVRRLVADLGAARAWFPKAGSGTLTAAASALQAGADPAVLRRIAEAGRATSDGDLAYALVALADLTASRVSPSRAGQAIGQLLTRGAPPSEIAAFRTAVMQDILAGRTPDDAVASQVRIFVRPDVPVAPAAAGRQVPPVTPPPGSGYNDQGR